MTVFDSRNEIYRKPGGAVEEGTQVHFKVCLPRYLSANNVKLITRNEHTGEAHESDMFWCGMNGDDNEWWEVDFTPESSGMWLYGFEVKSLSGDARLTRGWSGKAELTRGEAALWQLSVYDKDYSTPEWMKGGIIYQIFPDRFRKSAAEHKGVPQDRVIHSEWNEQPHWRPDDNGKYRNNDYFGGDLRGIIEKLPYLKQLSVSCIYLNPIFEAHENHRYGTANYEKIDTMLGTEADFKLLCKKAAELGIRVILDGVFSHTGCDSIYFNQTGRYDSLGAYNSKESPYYPWYTFTQYPDKYASWWGITTLPEVNENEESYVKYICGEQGILRKWIAAGASGWRLDVADELPDGFLDNLRRAVKKESSDAVIIGEVWEDATSKIAYGNRRRYLLGKQLDSVMNYPFKDSIVGFVTGWDAQSAMENILSILENYPPQSISCLMNLIDSHDTMRALTLLGGENVRGRDRAWQASQRLSGEQYSRAKSLLRLATVMQYTLPGVPSIYYGDEAGVEGYLDPFCRATFPWGAEDSELFEWYVMLGKLRRSLDCLSGVSFRAEVARGSLIAYRRKGEFSEIYVALNAAWNDEEIELPKEFVGARCLLGDYAGGEKLKLRPISAVILAK